MYMIVLIFLDSECSSPSTSDSWIVGKVVLCFTSESDPSAIVSSGLSIKEAGGLGLIIAKRPTGSSYSCGDSFPCVQVSYELGYQILSYIRLTRSTIKTHTSKSIHPTPSSFPCFLFMRMMNVIYCSNPRVRIGPSQTRVGKPLSISVAYFSSRGPNYFAPAILKVSNSHRLCR